MGQPTVFDADWLQVLAALRPDEHAAAALAFGLPGWPSAIKALSTNK